MTVNKGAEVSLVWRRLAKLHEEQTPHVIWAAGFSERCCDVVCRIALQVGFVSASRLGGFIVLKRDDAAKTGKENVASFTDVSTIDSFVMQKVEEYLHNCLLDFTRRRDRFVDICVTCYPLPPATVTGICLRLVAQLELQPCRLNARALRIFKGVKKFQKQRPRSNRRLPCWNSSPQLITFPGPVVYIRQFADAQFCCELLHRFKIRHLGMDTEWKPHRDGTDDDNPTALIQLCFRTPQDMKKGCLELPTARGSEVMCFLLHVVHHGVNPALAALLEDPEISKIGIEISGDVEKLRRHYGVDVQSTVELHDEAQARRGIYARGLRSLFYATVGCDYPKDKTITMSNWEVAPLSEQQQDYAACDAFAALRIYEALNEQTDLSL